MQVHVQDSEFELDRRVTGHRQRFVHPPEGADRHRPGRGQHVGDVGGNHVVILHDQHAAPFQTRHLLPIPSRVSAGISMRHKTPSSPNTSSVLARRAAVREFWISWRPKPW